MDTGGSTGLYRVALSSMNPQQQSSPDYATRADVRRVEDKLDGLSITYVTRGEYVAAQTLHTTITATMTAQISELSRNVERNREAVESNNKTGGIWLLAELDKIEQRLATRLDNQETKADERFSVHQTEHSKHSQWWIGLLYSSGSAVVIGVIVVIVQHFIH